MDNAMADSKKQKWKVKLSLAANLKTKRQRRDGDKIIIYTSIVRSTKKTETDCSTIEILNCSNIIFMRVSRTPK